MILLLDLLGRVGSKGCRPEPRKGHVDDLVELGLADDDSGAEVVEDGTPPAKDSRAGFAGSVVVLVIASVAGVALLAWLVLFWLAPPVLAWLDSHGV